jgi:hypothetical protein
MFAQLVLGFCTVMAAGWCPAAAQEIATPGPAYRLLAPKNVNALQQELDRASAEGYEVALAWPAYQLAVLRRRDPTEPAASYRVLNGEKAIKEALAQGYRAVPDTLDVKRGALLAIAVKCAAGDRHESLILQTSRTHTLEKEIQTARATGFHVIGLTSDDTGHAALLERLAGDPSRTESANAIALIAASAQDTLQKELASQAAAGYQIAQAASWKETVLVLERRDGVPVDYQVLSTTKSHTLEREMNAAVAKGYRLRPGTLHAQQKGAVPMLGRMGSDFIAIMEKATDAVPPPGYVIIGARRTQTLVREFEAAVEQGLVPVALTLGYSEQETVVVFERPPQ